MEQYYLDEQTVIKNAAGKPIKVSIFRSRVDYSKVPTSVALVRGDENLRIDTLADRLVGGIYKIGRIIDCNEKDIFSFNTGDKIKYVRS